MRVLVTGATGYIGGRLVPRLLQRGHTVRVVVRDPDRLAGRPWADQVDIRGADFLDPRSLHGVFDGIEVAYYLVHSMYTGGDFARRERRAATHFCQAGARLPHVIYLGGLAPHSTRISKHLYSRADVGRVLAWHLPTTELRAGPIIGSGSASFEMVRYLTERLPIMVAPRWLLNLVQPIAVRDVLSYLTLALAGGPRGIVEIGGDQLTFKQMIQGYAKVRGLRRLVIVVPPFLPTWLGARWIGFITPIPNTLAVPLVEGILHPVTVNDDSAARLFPQVEPIRYQEAVRLALQRIQQDAVETHWSGALGDAPSYERRDWEGLIEEVRTLYLDVPPQLVFHEFAALGGDRGWLVWRWAWSARAALDRLLGGPGLRRGRRHPQELLPGEAVDFWRVETVTPPHLLRLRAEMKLPGRGWLQWEALPEKTGTRLIQTAAFAPRGLFGTLYWYLLYPFHRLIFTALIEAIAQRARRAAQP